MLLVVAESSGSSPGRQGYKMAVGSDGELCGSIGGGVMEVNLVEESRRLLSLPPAVAGGLREQVHRKDAPNASGMICSGKQTVIFRLLSESNAKTVDTIIASIKAGTAIDLRITNDTFDVNHGKNPPATAGSTDRSDRPDTIGADFVATGTDFTYTERLGFKNDLYIIGGGHCALALSEIMSKMDFHISLFDDRPDLNTIEKNRFAHEVTIVDGYENIAAHVPPGSNSYVVVMTLGYRSDAVVIRSLLDHEFKYFGVLGSNAKMASMFKEFIKEGMPAEKLDRIRTPVGIAINSRTPEEIAVSIAAEIISVKNSD
jgi:xanthine dehydrogenase accessory factor